MSFDGKVILVTGGSSGIGAEIARHLATLGGKVAIVGRNAERLNEVAEQIEAIRASASLAIVADVVTDSDRIITETIKHFGQLDVLVNNAGVVTRDNIETYDDDEFNRIFDINVRGVIKLTQLAVPHLEKTKGNIVNISSVAGLKPVKDVLSYCISKAALDQFTQCTALDLAGKGIRVNAVNPAVIKTPIFQTVGVPLEAMDDFVAYQIPFYPGQLLEDIPQRCWTILCMWFVVD